MPGAEPVQERVEVPEPPVMLSGDGEHERLVELVDTARSTVPAKPHSGDTVMVEVPATPTLVDTVVGLAEIEKSGVGIAYVTFTE